MLTRAVSGLLTTDVKPARMSMREVRTFEHAHACRRRESANRANVGMREHGTQRQARECRCGTVDSTPRVTRSGSDRQDFRGCGTSRSAASTQS